MIIDRDKHNKYVAGWKPNYTVPTNQGSSSGTNVTIVYGGGGSGSSTPVSSEAFSYYKVSDGENAITQEAKVLKDIANLSIIGDEGIKVELITDPTIFEANFTSIGTNEGVYKISYGKVTTVVELPTKPETLAEEPMEPTEPEVIITFPMVLTYVSGEKIKAELFDTLRLLNDKEEVATYPSSGLAIEGDVDGILSISLEVYKEVLSVDEEGKPISDAEGNPVMEKLGLYFNKILLTSLLEDQPSTQVEGDSTEEEPQQPTYESLLSFDVVVNIDTVIKLSSDSGAGLWKLDDNGNIYTEYNAYSLKELSAYGPGEGEAGEGVGFLHELGDVSIPAPNEIPDNAILQYNIETDKWEAVEWSELDDTATREWVELKFKNLINGAPADLDTLGEIAIVMRELQQLLDWFSFVDGRIRANYDFWGIGEISAYGPASGSDPGTGGGAGYLHELGDVTINNDTLANGLIIVWDEDSLRWVNVDFSGLDEGALALYLTQNKYATLGWVNSQLDPINNKLEEFQTTIDMINDMFEWDNGRIKAKATLYSVGEISAYGAGGGSSGTSGYLHELDDVLLTDLQNDQLLMYDASIGKWINVDKNSVGLNETELEQYLTTHNYVTSDRAVSPTRKIIAGTGLTGGGSLSADVTLSLATSGVTVGTYTKVTVDRYGRVTVGALLIEDDIPDIAWSKIHSTPTTLAGYGITDAYTMLQSDERYVNVIGDIMTGNLILPTLLANTSIILGSVKLEYDSANNALKVSNVNTQQAINLYATGEISAYGYNDGSSSTGGYLHELEDVTLSNLLNGQALVYNSSTGQWVNTTILADGIDEAALADYLTNNQYATQQWVTSQNYLTAVSVDTISDLHSSWDAVLKAQKPAWLTTVSLATISDLNASWDALLKTAPSAYVTRWPAFSEVTGKPTTLSGYGITDGVSSVTVAGTGNAVTAASISGHVLTLTKGTTFLVKSTFDDLFEKVALDGGGYAIRAKYALYSESWISAKGKNPDAGGTAVGGSDTLEGLDDVQIGTKVNGQVLSWNATSKKWVNKTIESGLDETALAEYLTDNGYATQGWATSQFAYKTGTNASGTWPIAILVKDIRGTSPTPNDKVDKAVDFWFNNTGKPGSDAWYSGITVKGWSDGYAVWQLASASSTALSDDNLYFRSGLGSTWKSWRKILDTTNYTSTLDSRYLRTVSLATISDLHASWDALLKASPSAYVTRWPAWSEVTSKPTWIGANKPSYAFSEITGKPTTLGGYGITDAYTKTESNANYFYKSIYNPNSRGCLVQTDIAANIDAMVTVVISGNNYLGNSKPLYSLLNFYNYNSGNDIINISCQNVGFAFGSIKIFNYGGYVCLWLPYHHNFMSYSLFIFTTNYLIYRNRVTSITNAAVPSSATRLVTVTPKQTALISDNVYSATKLQTARKIWGQSFNGEADVSGALSNATTITASGQIQGGSFKLGSGTITWDATNNCFHFSHGIYSDSFVSAKGANSGSGGTVSGVTKLSDLSDVQLGTLATNQVLTWNGSKWVNKAVSTGLDETALAQYLTNNQYLTMPTGDGRYVTLATAQTISGKKTFTARQIIRGSYWAKRMTTDTSNYEDAICWLNTSLTQIAKIGYHNTEHNIIINPINASDAWKDAIGKYSLFVGKNKLTYNTYPILTSNNYSSTLDTRYVKKAGDTMTGALTVPSLAVSGSTATVSGNKVWHAGNDGSGSGLDADLLDGVHLANIRELGYAMQKTTIDASSLNVNTWYPVTIKIDANHQVLIAVIVSLDSGTKPSWSTHQNGFSVRKVWYTNGSGWGTNSVNRTVLFSDYLHTSTDPVRGLNQLTNSNNEYVYVRGGGKYRFYISHGKTPILHTSTYTVHKQSVSPTTTAPAAIRRTNALITDNVYSATQLQTARTINGTAFNGTSNIVTSYWGTARNFYIRDHDSSHTGAAVSVNGSANEYLLLPSTITATLNGNATSASYWQTARTLAVSGDATGSVSIRGNANMSLSLDVKYATSAGNADTVDSLHASAFARKDQNPAVDLNTVNGNGIMSNYANANATTARHYPIQEAGTLFYGAAAYGSANQIYGTFNSNRWFFRGGGSSTTAKTAWKEMAFLTSNVASASKLQTSQKIWGRPFDGTAPVSGDMTGVGSISASGAIGTTSVNILQFNTYTHKNVLRFDWGTYSSDALFIDIPGTNPQNVWMRLVNNFGLRVSGGVSATGGIYSESYVSAKGNNSSSDIRLKNILSPVCPSLKAFAKAPLFRFAWKSNPGMVEIGSSAQYWKSVLPDTVKERDGWLEMGYGNIALAGVITIARDFETLEQRVDRLEKENNKLKAKLSKLERRIK